MSDDRSKLPTTENSAAVHDHAPSRTSEARASTKIDLASSDDNTAKQRRIPPCCLCNAEDEQVACRTRKV